MSGYWHVIVPISGTMMACVVAWVMAYRPGTGQHAAAELEARPPALDATLARAEVGGRPPWADLPDKQRPEIVRRDAGGYNSGPAWPLDDLPEPGEWTDRLLRDLHDTGPRPRGMTEPVAELESSDPPGQGMPEGGPGLPASGTEPATTAGGDESEASGPPALPARHSCCCHGGFSGEHDCCIHPSGAPALGPRARAILERYERSRGNGGAYLRRLAAEGWATA